MSNETEKKLEASPEVFFTRQRANEGIELPLALPDGTPTAHMIRIRGIDSDTFKRKNAEMRRKAVELAQIKDEDVLQQKILEGELELIACLVIDWTFDMPCTKANVIKFLTEAPQIASEINILASKRSLFFKNSSGSSSSLPEQSSS